MKSLYEQLRDADEDIKAQEPVVWDDVDNLLDNVIADVRKSREWLLEDMEGKKEIKDTE